MSELQALPLALNTWGTFSVFSARQREEGERSTLSAEYESVRGSAVRQEHRSDNQPPLCFAPAPYPAPGTRKERMDNEGRTTASLGHLTLTEPRFVSNGDRESGLAAEQEDTSPLCIQPSFCPSCFSNSDQTSACKHRVATTLSAKSGSPGGKSQPQNKSSLSAKRPYFQLPRGFLSLLRPPQTSPVPVPGHSSAAKGWGADPHPVPGARAPASWGAVPPAAAPVGLPPRTGISSSETRGWK